MDAETNTAFPLNKLVIWWGGQLSEITSPTQVFQSCGNVKVYRAASAPLEEMRRARCAGPA